jgi:hypothetical protein
MSFQPGAIDTAQPWRAEPVIAHSALLDASFRHWLGRPLLNPADDARAFAEHLYHAPFVVVSHGTEDDPLFNYANLAAQRLWELDWPRFVGMPSRHSAEPAARGERAESLAAALQKGFIAGYEGIRIARGGRRFHIRDGVIWNLFDRAGEPRGQAATFARWDFL